MRKLLLMFIAAIAIGLTNVAHAENDTLEKIKKQERSHWVSVNHQV